MERLILASPMQAFPANCSKMYRAWQLRTLYRRLVSNANTIIEGNKRTWWSQVTPPLKGISEFLIVARVIHTSKSSQPRIGIGLKNRISVVFEKIRTQVNPLYGPSASGKFSSPVWNPTQNPARWATRICGCHVKRLDFLSLKNSRRTNKSPV